VENQDKIKWIYSSRNNQELTDRYDQWAKDYDSDLEEEHDYQGPKLTTEFFTRFVPKTARILDAGAGTGLMGEVLSKLGYTDLVAIDLSKGMLEEAQRKNVYRELRRMVLGETLDFATNSFDAVVSVGTFTMAHAPASSFDELIRITRPGGYIIFTLSTEAYEKAGFREKFVALESNNGWRFIEKSKNQKLTTGSDFYHQVWVYQVTS
jgi:SAM-dependent methyltransferase